MTRPQLINKALGSRDSRVHYRIGSRLHAWTDDLYIYGTESQLELERNYKVINLDELLRRRENSGDWIFPGFARDVFERRVQNAGFTKLNNSENQLSKFLGKGLTPEQTATRYASSSADHVLSKSSTLPRPLQLWLTDIARTNPLEAKLGEAWFLQKEADTFDIATIQEPYPWNQPRSTWWRKERVRQALMQLAKQNSQRMIWSGEDDVLSLSGGNILVFVSLCQNIWAAWLRRFRELEIEESPDVPAVDPLLQAVGIQMASTQWYGKIPEQSGKSAQRQRFIDILGTTFRNQLLDDTAMSYPGHNGFSLKNDDLKNNIIIQSFIREAVDFGDLFEVAHTTKEQNRFPRTKWYLNPILSPHFQIPDKHIKEPMYVDINNVQEWMAKAGLVEAPLATVVKRQRKIKNKKQMTLPDFDSEGGV